MSSRTQRWRERLPSFLQPKRGPVLVDGLQELECAFQICEVLKPLEHNSKVRVLRHVWAIEQENTQRIAAFYGADVPDAEQIDDSQSA